MIVVVSYLPVLPPQGSCQVLGIDDAMASLFRQIASGLLEATRAAAEMADAMFVDMAGIGQGHDACSAQPWVNGKSPDHGAPFHPNAAGTRAIADAVYGRLSVVLTSRIPGR